MSNSDRKSATDTVTNPFSIIAKHFYKPAYKEQCVNRCISRLYRHNKKTADKEQARTVIN